jgi:hypothetical protein
MNAIAEWLTMNKPSPELIELLFGLRRQLEQSSHGEAGQLIESFSRCHGRSHQTVWRWLNVFAGYETGRKKRSDAGKTACSEETLSFIAASKQMSVRANGKATKPTAVALGLRI